MREYFQEQLKNTKKDIKKEDLKQLKGRSVYSDFQEGDIIAIFFIEKLNELSLIMIAEREIENLKNDFNFIRMSTEYPVFERK